MVSKRWVYVTNSLTALKYEMVWHSLIAWIGFLSEYYPKPTCGFLSHSLPIVFPFPTTISAGKSWASFKYICCRNTLQKWLKKVLRDTYSGRSGDMIVFNYNCWAMFDHCRGMFLLFYSFCKNSTVELTYLYTA